MIDYGKVITTESIHEGNVLSTKVCYEQSIFTNKESLITDIIKAMAVITSGETKSLTLEVKVKEDGKVRIIKAWGI